MSDHVIEDGIVYHRDPDTGRLWPDAMSVIVKGMAPPAKVYREMQGITGPPPHPTPPDVIYTRPFAGRCMIVDKIWPPGWPHSVRLLVVRAGDLSPEARERLRAA